MHGPGNEPMTAGSEVRRPNHCATETPRMRVSTTLKSTLTNGQLLTYLICLPLLVLQSLTRYLVIYLTLDLSSSRIQMAALGHRSTPFCFVVRQFLSFFPGQVHLSKVSFVDIYPVLHRSSLLSLVTSQFPLCSLTSCSRVVSFRARFTNVDQISVQLNQVQR